MKANTLSTFDISFLGDQKKKKQLTLNINSGSFFPIVSNFQTSNGKRTAVYLHLKYLPANPLFPSSVSP